MIPAVTRVSLRPRSKEFARELEVVPRFADTEDFRANRDSFVGEWPNPFSIIGDVLAPEVVAPARGGCACFQLFGGGGRERRVLGIIVHGQGERLAAGCKEWGKFGAVALEVFGRARHRNGMRRIHF